MVRDTHGPRLDAQVGPPIRRTQELKALKITEPRPGVAIFDLGQNMVGWARLKVRGPAGTRVTLRHGEMLNRDGTLFTANLRRARATDEYILRGGETEVFEPHFTYHGFRYVELTGYPGKPSLDAVTGVVIHSDIPRAGKFECSHPLVNQLQRNIDWTQRGNFFSIPTDCPQRDERLGWTGDAQLFCRTSACNRDVARFFTKWMTDLEDAQSEDGAIPDTVPNVYSKGINPGWGDAGIIVPWTVYLCYGDRRLLENHYTGMVKWNTFLQKRSREFLQPAGAYGDWLCLDPAPPKELVATAYYAYSTRLLARTARALGKREDAKKYQELFEKIRSAFGMTFIDKDGRVKGGSQTAYALALRFELMPRETRAAAVKRLRADIGARGGHLATGFVGTGHLLPALAEGGAEGTAYQLLVNETFPSWGYQIKNGATTVWERWDGWTREKGIHPGTMNSFNQYAFATVGEWLFEGVAGIAPDFEAPGYQHTIIRPRPGPDLTWAQAEYASMYGPIVSSWKVEKSTFQLEVRIPANVRATVHVPAPANAIIREGSQPAANAQGVRFLRHADGCAVYEVDSGVYRFTR
jgi:alpha-L-rhamnosidase